jgi:hypothetical protein
MANVKNGKEKELSVGACIHYIFHAVFVRSLEVCFLLTPDRGQSSCRRYHEHISSCGIRYKDLCSCLQLVQFVLF